MLGNPRALWLEAPERPALRAEAVPDPGPGEVLVEAQYGALSRGSERLAYRGAIPPSEAERMRAPFQAGAFPGPVKYGYATAGRIVAGDPARRGEAVFCLHPHQERFVVPADAARPVPAGVPLGRAVLAANLETALNAVWDGGAAPAERICAVGAGVVGSLAGYLAARLPGSAVTLVDPEPARTELAAALGAAYAPPERAPTDCDRVLHASATAAGLATALAAAGTEATVVELSWYGDAAPAVPLGQAFHSRRLRLQSSQVGRVAARQRPRWSPQRRLDAALGLLADPVLDRLIACDVAFADLPGKLGELLGPEPLLAPRIVYPPAQ